MRTSLKQACYFRWNIALLFTLLTFVVCTHLGCSPKQQGNNVQGSLKKTAAVTDTVVPLFGQSLLPSIPEGIQNAPLNSQMRTDFERADALYNQLNYEESLSLLQHVLDEYKKNYSNDKRGIALLYERLGAISLGLDFSKESNRVKPKEYLENALDILKELNANFGDQATCHYYLGRYLSIMQEPKQAIENYKQSIDLFKQANSSQSRQVAQVLFSLAYMDPQNGMSSLNNAMKIVEIEMGEEHPDVGKIYLGMGSSKFSRDFREDALRDYNHALSIFEEKLGKYSPEAAEAQFRLGDLYADCNDIPKALTSYLYAYYVFSQRSEFKIRAELSLEQLRILYSWTNDEQPFDKWLDSELKKIQK